MSPEEAEEFERILRLIEKEPGDKDEYLRRLGKICDKADGFKEEEVSQAEALLDGELHQKIWNEAADMRRSGELLKRFQKVSCPITLIQGEVDPHPIQGVTRPLTENHVDVKSFVIRKCGHTPWRETYAKEEFARILFSEIGNVS